MQIHGIRRNTGAALVLFASLLLVHPSAFTASVEVPTKGTPQSRVEQLWAVTRATLVADAAVPWTDAQYLSKGAPLHQAWAELAASLGSTTPPSTRAVTKILNDFYGRPGGSPERRPAARRDLLRNFAMRLEQTDRRVR